MKDTCQNVVGQRCQVLQGIHHRDYEVVVALNLRQDLQTRRNTRLSVFKLKLKVAAHVFKNDPRVAVAQFSNHSTGWLHVFLRQSPVAIIHT